MAQPNESDFAKKFSTLNVNAMEFVPSFCSSQTSAPSPPSTTTTPAEAEAAAAAAVTETQSTPDEPSPTVDNSFGDGGGGGAVATATPTVADVVAEDVSAVTVPEASGTPPEEVTATATATATETIDDKSPENPGAFRHKLFQCYCRLACMHVCSVFRSSISVRLRSILVEFATGSQHTSLIVEC